MSKLTVAHYLNVYQNRLVMLDEGIINPSDEMIVFAKRLVGILLQFPLTEIVSIKNNTMLDSSGNVMITFPDDKT
ncbi:hypothetical protein D3C71_1645410 [compost metagenome]